MGVCNRNYGESFIGSRILGIILKLLPRTQTSTKTMMACLLVHFQLGHVRADATILDDGNG